MVPDDEWKRYVGPFQKERLCLECYRAIQGWIDKLEPNFLAY